jgi:hypothetical protein
MAGIPPDVAALMIKPQDPIEGEAWEAYGFAVRLDKNNKPYRIGFAGSDEVFMTYFGWLPQQDVFIYVVGNNGMDNVRSVIQKVLHSAYEVAGITPDMLQPQKK